MIAALFTRTRSYNYEKFCISNMQELTRDIDWAQSRKLVKQRCSLPPEEGNPWNDNPYSYEKALNLSERKRLEMYRTSLPNCSWDLGQDMDFCLRSRLEDPLHTLVKGQGITWNSGLSPERWFTPEECFTAMGFPVDLVHAATMGAWCSFTRGYTNERRSRSSMLHQSGNAMH
eukprot:13767196-Alexandrium_andersonii.AAC.1